MDISSEAAVSPFAIGPTTVLGRTLALRILYLPSIRHLRRQISGLLRGLVLLLSSFHPKNAHGILLGVALIAFVVKRFSSVRSRAESAYRRKFWGNMMKSAVTYEEWAHAARMMERDCGRRNDGELYDEELVRNKLRELRQRREEGCLRDIVFCMRADLVRNLGNMCNPKLHKGRLQVPKLIKEYIDEVSMQLKMICDSECDDLLLEEKLAFMHETRHAYGRTALLLSGGASLGAFHVGVVKTLVEHKLLPRIIAGSSVGSIMCSIVATRSWPELETFFEDTSHSLQFFDQMGGLYAVFKRITTLGAVHDITQLQRMLRRLTSNLTFQEAYDMTGRVLGITVCSPRKHEPPRCLNYLTSPHVVIWSAVTASCAFPGLFEAQELMAKDRFGEIVPFHAPFLDGPEEVTGSARRWRDGSLEMDLPMIQLKELFNVNHFIVSQANPHIVPLLRMKELVTAYCGNFASKLAHLAEMEVKHRCHQILELGFPLGGIAKLFAQDWEGDVTVVMPATLAQYSKIIQNPSYMELQKAANQGRRGTWEKLSAIKANCAIELALDECVALLNHMRRLKRNAARAAASQGITPTLKINPSRRIPSWNRIARENSTGSIEEDFLTDAAAAIHQMTSQHARGARSVYDGSDSESESIDLNCWTRSGGPLMKTASAAKFIQDLDIDPEPNRFLSREDEGEGSASAHSSSNSIVVSEGDLLQPERIHNGIVFNVVKKEDLNLANRVENSEQFQAPAEEVVDILQTESCNASVASECGDEYDVEKSSFIDETSSHLHR